MGKIIKFADGGSFSSRVSSFLKAPKFNPTALDIPDIEGMMMFATQPKPTSGKTLPKPKEYNFTLPEMNVLASRGKWITDNYNRLLDDYYDRMKDPKFAQSNDRDRYAQHILNWVRAEKVKAERERKAFDDARKPNDEVAGYVYTRNGGANVTVRLHNPKEAYTDENGKKIEAEAKGLHTISFNDYLDNKDRYTSPINIEGYLDAVDQELSRGSLNKEDKEYVGVFSRPYVSSLDDAYSWVANRMSPTASGGKQSIWYTTMNEMGVDHNMVTNNPSELFLAIGAST